jgi:DNA-directed RNA polymerase specialized sigma24 family protein
MPELPVADDVELKRRLTNAIDELPADLRAMVLLHYAEGYKHRELADLMGIPEGTSKARLFRARALLRRSLGIEPDPPAREVPDPVLTMGSDRADTTP